MFCESIINSKIIDRSIFTQLLPWLRSEGKWLRGRQNTALTNSKMYFLWLLKRFKCVLDICMPTCHNLNTKDTSLKTVVDVTTTDFCKVIATGGCFDCWRGLETF